MEDSGFLLAETIQRPALQMSHFNNVQTLTFSTISLTNSVTKEAGQRVKRALPARESVSELAFQNTVLQNVEPGAEPTKPKRGPKAPQQHTTYPLEAHSIQSLLDLVFFYAPPRGRWESTVIEP